MTTSDHKGFYEIEAADRTRRPHDPKSPRGRLRIAFAELVRSEGRTSIIDFGCGPGIDAGEFADRGVRYVGVDLALGNARLAAETNLTVIPGSMLAPPLRHRSFEAGWSMSALMHLPDHDATHAVSQMLAVLTVGAPITIGTWGSPEQRQLLDDEKLPGQRRHFYLRSLEANIELIDQHGDVEFADRLDEGPSGWEYHVLRLRA